MRLRIHDLYVGRNHRRVEHILPTPATKLSIHGQAIHTVAIHHQSEVVHAVATAHLGRHGPGAPGRGGQVTTHDVLAVSTGHEQVDRAIEHAGQVDADVVLPIAAVQLDRQAAIDVPGAG